ncbi:anion permease [Chitinophagaceae bacterium LB-8]|uniref:Anion permease n=1 Tax=Paraflavisolibacter caeni TaxID=2982496 RepID=A0A9X2XUS9_9BACT|nr:anion permease [Paraflavisolibacter caeni]MCU7549679.1 anion permease [Paraflavisolibacter caeni]
MTEINYKTLIPTFIFGLILWFITPPEGVSLEAWHLFSIFISTIVGIVLKAASMGTLSIVAIALVALSGVLAPDNTEQAITKALSGFGNSIIWLITISFFIARGFIKTGLGARIAYWLIKIFGKTSLGLAYCLSASELILAPAIPSNTARSGGIIYPIMKSIALSFDSKPDDEESRKKIGRFLTLSAYNANIIASTMFLTATASNPICQKFAANMGINMSWGSWALAALVPGLVGLLVTPLVIKRVIPPTITDTKQASIEASAKLKEMGGITRNEWFMIITFFILLFLWIFGSVINVNATTTAFIGVSILLISQVLNWEDVKSEKSAWDTMVWFSALVMMASGLNALGFIDWFSGMVKAQISTLSWRIAFPIIILVYFYSHYIFASATAHVAAMYAALLGVGISLGIPGGLLAYMLAFIGSVFGTLTHYGHGPAPVLFGSGYVTVKEWWKTGAILSVVFILIWMVIGGAWLKIIGVF